MPAEKQGFVINIVQAIASATPRDKYKPNLIRWMEETIERILRDAAGPERRSAVSKAQHAHLVVMAFDGFILYHRTHPGSSLNPYLVEAVTDMILGHRAD
jgi:hypothetical protein